MARRHRLLDWLPEVTVLLAIAALCVAGLVASCDPTAFR